jgi:hypothetical protein
VNASGFAKISGAEIEGSITYDVYTHSSANTDAEAALWPKCFDRVITYITACNNKRLPCFSNVTIDTLTLDGSGLTLDRTNISNTRIQDIEKIDITGSGNNYKHHR